MSGYCKQLTHMPSRANEFQVGTVGSVEYALTFVIASIIKAVNFSVNAYLFEVRTDGDLLKTDVFSFISTTS